MKGQAFDCIGGRLENIWAALRGLLLMLGYSILLGERSSGASLEIEIAPKFSGAAVQVGSLRYETTAGESFSITRVSYLLTGFALQRVDGSWLELTNEVAWLDLEAGRSFVRMRNVPQDLFRGVRFQVGLDKKMNNADVAQFPAEHPLNPNLNGLHWSWQGGYVFLALEGRWRNSEQVLDGWSYHLATDTNLTGVTIAATLDLTRDAKLELDFDLAMLINGPRSLSFAKDGSSTHSREGDPIAAALTVNLPRAFRIRGVSVASGTNIAATNAKPLYLPEKFTPYRFQISETFPIPDLPRDNPLTEERVALGEKLFHSTALSKDETISCASCHQSTRAFADGGQFSVGVREQVGYRNSMPLLNLAWKKSFFWDGRALSLREQALMPIQDHVEMDESLSNVVARLSRDASYCVAFASAFGATEITSEKIGLAIESFVLTLTSCDSKFDRVLKGEEKFTEAEQRGFELFSTEYDPRREQFGADCFHCHGGALFQSQTFANNGLDSEFKDLGRGIVTGKNSDQGKFATPSLRNIAVTAPYMHDGRFATLEEVVEHYSSGVKRSTTLDPNLAKHPDGGVHLSEADRHALVEFLKTLTDPRWREDSQKLSQN